jgi:hypothetical protein
MVLPSVVYGCDLRSTRDKHHKYILIFSAFFWPLSPFALFILCFFKPPFSVIIVTRFSSRFFVSIAALLSVGY